MGMVAQACDLGTWEAETRVPLGAQDQRGLHSESKIFF